MISYGPSLVPDENAMDVLDQRKAVPQPADDALNIVGSTL